MRNTNNNTKTTKNKATVVISAYEHKLLSKLSNNYNMNMGQFMELAIQFFRKSGINPADDTYSPSEHLISLENRMIDVIKIIKAIERDKLSALLENQLILLRRIEEGFANLPNKEYIQELFMEMMKSQTKSINTIIKLFADSIESNENE